MSATASLRSNSDAPSKRPPTPAKDLEYGYPAQPPGPRVSTSRPPSQRLSQKSGELAWNAQHPCYPHPNPYVPLASPIHEATRIIRIPRDWMIAGDLAPTFSNTYPEILEPWVQEADFRTLIKGINERLIQAFDPLGWRAWMDLLLGIATGWIWDDLGFVKVKKGCEDVEQFIEKWNEDIRHHSEKDEEMEVVRVISLRKSGYLSLDIQIPDPHVGMIGDGDGDGRNGDVAGTEGETA